MRILKGVNPVILALVVFICIESAQAAFDISITPYEGGFDLRFGRVESFQVNQEVKIKISSTDNKQYQVFQRVLEPFVNDRGERLNMDAISSYTLRGSNSSGTLYQEGPASLGYADQILYTSNSNGDNDSFRMIYTAHADRLNVSGKCLGKILYTVQPIAGGTQQTYILDAFLEAAGEFKIEVKSSSGRDLIGLGTQRDEDKQDYAVFSFAGNMGSELKIYQEIIELPQNELRQEINEDCIQFSTSGGDRSELYYASPSPLERRKVLLCSSDNEQDAFTVNFLLDEERILNQKAGMYKGKVNYVIEGFGIQEIIPLHLEVEITPIFQMDVQLPAEGLRFSNLEPKSAPVTREITISVKTNLGRPYIVTQNMRSSVASEEGKQIPSRLFTMKQELIGEESGIAKFSDFSPVPLGEASLFFSDDHGSSIQFKIIYRVKPDWSIHVGDYSTIINYSLQEK